MLKLSDLTVEPPLEPPNHLQSRGHRRNTASRADALLQPEISPYLEEKAPPLLATRGDEGPPPPSAA
jgi:hypothetical protein